MISQYMMSLCSQSGKLVQKMFHKIQELIDDSEALVCVLIDEVSEPLLSLPTIAVFFLVPRWRV